MTELLSWLLLSFMLVLPALVMPPLFTLSCSDACSGSVPASVSITVSGFANKTCTGCTNYNSTWVIAEGVFAPCGGSQLFTGPCGDRGLGGFAFNQIDWNIITASSSVTAPPSGSDIVLRVRIQDGWGNLYSFDKTLATSPITCSGYGTVTGFTYNAAASLDFAPTDCDYSGVSISVTM